MLIIDSERVGGMVVVEGKRRTRRYIAINNVKQHNIPSIQTLMTSKYLSGKAKKSSRTSRRERKRRVDAILTQQSRNGPSLALSSTSRDNARHARSTEESASSVSQDVLKALPQAISPNKAPVKTISDHSGDVNERREIDGYGRQDVDMEDLAPHDDSSDGWETEDEARASGNAGDDEQMGKADDNFDEGPSQYDLLWEMLAEDHRLSKGIEAVSKFPCRQK